MVDDPDCQHTPQTYRQLPNRRFIAAMQPKANVHKSIKILNCWINRKRILPSCRRKVYLPQNGPSTVTVAHIWGLSMLLVATVVWLLKNQWPTLILKKPLLRKWFPTETIRWILAELLKWAAYNRGTSSRRIRRTIWMGRTRPEKATNKQRFSLSGTPPLSAAALNMTVVLNGREMELLTKLKIIW